MYLRFDYDYSTFSFDEDNLRGANLEHFEFGLSHVPLVGRNGAALLALRAAAAATNADAITDHVTLNAETVA